MVMFSVRKQLFTIYGKSLQCQLFLTVRGKSNFYVKGNSLGLKVSW